MSKKAIRQMQKHQIFDYSKSGGFLFNLRFVYVKPQINSDARSVEAINSNSAPSLKSQSPCLLCSEVGPRSPRKTLRYLPNLHLNRAGK